MGTPTQQAQAVQHVQAGKTGADDHGIKVQAL
jgi:hypothetical protein